MPSWRGVEWETILVVGVVSFLVCKRIIGEKAVRGGIPWSEYLMLAEIDVLWGNIAELMQK